MSRRLERGRRAKKLYTLGRDGLRTYGTCTADSAFSPPSDEEGGAHPSAGWLNSYGRSALAEVWRPPFNHPWPLLIQEGIKKRSDQHGLSGDIGTGDLAYRPAAVATEVCCADGALTVVLYHGRTVSVPLAWFPRLLNATGRQRQDWELIGGGVGIHREAIDEDISVVSLLRPERLMRLVAPTPRPSRPPARSKGNAIPSPRRKHSSRRE